MNKDFDIVLRDALSLDHDSKVRLAERIAVDLANADNTLKEWVAESNRRFDEYKRGAIQGRDSAEAMREIRRKITGS